MNRRDRTELAKALALMNQAKEILETLKDAEREKYDNLSEGLQASSKGEAIGTAADALESAYDGLNNAVSELEGME